MRRGEIPRGLGKVDWRGSDQVKRWEERGGRGVKEGERKRERDEARERMNNQKMLTT